MALDSSDIPNTVYVYQALKWCQNTTSYDIYSDSSCSATETTASIGSPSIAMGSGDIQHIAYGITGSGGQLKYHTSRYTSGGKYYGIPVDTSGTAYFTDIAIGPDGCPQIAYLLSTGTLKHARWVE